MKIQQSSYAPVGQQSLQTAMFSYKDGKEKVDIHGDSLSSFVIPLYGIAALASLEHSFSSVYWEGTLCMTSLVISGFEVPLVFPAAEKKKNTHGLCLERKGRMHTCTAKKESKRGAKSG